MTYTYVLMEVPPHVFQMVKSKLEDAGYLHAVHVEDDEVFLDMHGIALSIDHIEESVPTHVLMPASEIERAIQRFDLLALKRDTDAVDPKVGAKELRETLYNAPKSSTNLEETLNELRSCGWSVGCHNDYKLNGESYTYWQWTHPSGLYVKGEGKTDAEALEIVCKEARRVFAPSP